MSAEICKAIAFAGIIVFFNCLIILLAVCVLACMGEDLGLGVKFSELMNKSVAIIVVIGALALITAMNGGLLYCALE